MSLTPELFDKNYKIILPTRKCILDQNIRNLTFGKNEIILDVGCGPGHLTLDLLMPAFKPYLKHIVAVDISKSMLNFARKKYSHPQIYYKELDFSKPVTGEVKRDLLMNDLASKGFDRIVSFFCLMDIEDQRVVSRNTYELLKPGGEAFLVLTGKSTRDDVIFELSKISKWAKYTQMVEHLSVYNFSENPAQKLKQYLEEAGLDVIYSREDRRIYPYENSEDLKDMMCSIDTCLCKIPSEMKEEYINDTMDIIKREYGRYEFRLLTIAALVRKPVM